MSPESESCGPSAALSTRPAGLFLTHNGSAATRSFDRLLGERNQLIWDFEAQRPGGLALVAPAAPAAPGLVRSWG